ncbi:hypothetical protein AAG570_007498 [Ranatra chinensis]|uniref:Uncharacterized protein n=1 Tax=Ranatra chinensis TaxID=642074 RepID=A0ABD0YB65_9HEMI
MSRKDSNQEMTERDPPTLVFNLLRIAPFLEIICYKNDMSQDILRICLQTGANTSKFIAENGVLFKFYCGDVLHDRSILGRRFMNRRVSILIWARPEPAGLKANWEGNRSTGEITSPTSLQIKAKTHKKSYEIQWPSSEDTTDGALSTVTTCGFKPSRRRPSASYRQLGHFDNIIQLVEQVRGLRRVPLRKIEAAQDMAAVAASSAAHAVATFDSVKAEIYMLVDVIKGIRMFDGRSGSLEEFAFMVMVAHNQLAAASSALGKVRVQNLYNMLLCRIDENVRADVGITFITPVSEIISKLKARYAGTRRPVERTALKVFRMRRESGETPQRFAHRLDAAMRTLKERAVEE